MMVHCFCCQNKPSKETRGCRHRENKASTSSSSAASLMSTVSECFAEGGSGDFNTVVYQDTYSQAVIGPLAGCGKRGILGRDMGYYTRCVTRCGGASDARWRCQE